MNFTDIDIPVYKKIKIVKTDKSVLISSLKDKIKRNIKLDVEETPHAEFQKTIVGTWVNEASKSNIAPIMLVKDEGPFSVDDTEKKQKTCLKNNFLKKVKQ